MHKLTAAPVLALTLAMLLPASLAAQTVLVEDFETPDTPNYMTFASGTSMVTATNTWQITLNSIDLYEAAARPEAGAYDGAQAVDLTGSPGEGVMETTFATTPGAEYELVFHYARNAYVDPDTARAVVDVIGTGPRYQGFFFHTAPTSFGQFLEYRAKFTADSAVTTLRFTSQSPGVAGITIDGISISQTSTIGIAPDKNRVRLLDTHPNPFSRAVTLQYAIQQPGMVEARVHDARGRLIQTLVREEKSPGTYFATWSGMDRAGNPAPSGVYFLVLVGPGSSASKRVLFLR